MPTRRTRQRTGDLDPTLDRKPGVDGDLEHEYDLHRLLQSAHDPRVPDTPRGSTLSALWFPDRESSRILSWK